MPVMMGIKGASSMIMAKRLKKFGLGILLLVGLFWMQPALCARCHRGGEK